MSHFVKTSSNYVRIWPPGIHVTLKTYFCTDWQGSRSSGPLQSSFPITTMQATRTALICLFNSLPVIGFLGLSFLNIVEVFLLSIMFLD